MAMTKRYGPRPVALSGRAAELHPLITGSMRSTLPADFPLAIRAARGQRAAARIALNRAIA
jgi:hypothetical protein